MVSALSSGEQCRARRKAAAMFRRGTCALGPGFRLARHRPPTAAFPRAERRHFLADSCSAGQNPGILSGRLFRRAWGTVRQFEVLCPPSRRSAFSGLGRRQVPLLNDPEQHERVGTPSHRRRTVGKKLYVGNLPYNVSSSDLEQLFSPYGTVQRRRSSKIARQGEARDLASWRWALTRRAGGHHRT